jgi:hypothetical protein
MGIEWRTRPVGLYCANEVIGEPNSASAVENILTYVYSFNIFGRRAYYNNTVTLLIDLV